MSKFIGGIVIAAIPVILAVIGTFAAPAAGSPSCMTLEEARKAFPHDHIYWHGRQRCWDNDRQHRSQAPAANAGAAAAAAERSEAATPKEPHALKLSEALAERPSAPAVIPPIPFVNDEQRRELSWPVPNGAADNLSARAQQVEPPPPARKRMSQSARRTLSPAARNICCHVVAGRRWRPTEHARMTFYAP